MKKLIAVSIPVLMLFAGTFIQSSDEALAQETPGNTVNVDNNVDTYQSQSVNVSSGGDSSSSSFSNSNSSISTTSISNYEARTPPVTTFPPYLPYWNHGGWGTIKAYFPNGPNNDDQVYERVFNPDNPNDIRELKGVLESLPYENPLGILGGLLNGVGTVFGGPDNFHHGRGFEIASSLIRTRRPEGKPLLVFIDSNVDTDILRNSGYAYVGKVSLEGNVDRNWDHVYEAAVAEALPWNVDILLISGGMKGVTTGSNLSFPGAGGAYSQANYSISMFGSVSSGITEGKGKAVVSAAGYRYCPAAATRRRIPQAFYDRIQAQVQPVEKAEKVMRRIVPPVETQTFIEVPPEKPEVNVQQQYPQTDEEPFSVYMKEVPPETEKKKCEPSEIQKPNFILKKQPGIKVSRELLEMAGLHEHQQIYNLTVK
ncbi:MAG: hypothetical protein JW837_14300 [Sedimentisphaerales bacterium]|nr:hypothetical protein [Sedimentisphaerales bacterium]